jgi:NAD(P)-dependent dehydrogenase (short-subunit alcohol dehydrogenase family)
MRRLENKTAIITGAGRGIGLAAAQVFVREGASVVLAEIDDELGHSAEAQLCAAGGEATFVHTDCSKSFDVQALTARTESLYGALHVLYNNASVYLDNLDGPVTELAEKTWTKILAINLNSVFLCCRYALPLMIRSGGGSIINTGSSASVIGIPRSDAYTATKGATVALTRSLAVEYGPH